MTCALSYLLPLVAAAAIDGLSLRGAVTDAKGMPLPDAHVVEVRTGRTVVTETDGSFRLRLPADVAPPIRLEVSRVGYDPRRVRVGGSELDDSLLIRLSEAVYRAETLVVTGTRTLRDVEDVPVPVSVIPGERIRQAGQMRLSDVLAEQPGLQIMSDHGTGIQVQGFAPEYTLILLDGIPLIGRSAGTFDLTRVSVRNVEQIEIVKGPSSALWGSDALAGVINIITETPDEPFTAGFAARYGTHETVDVSADAAVARDGLRSSWSGNVNRSAGYSLDPASIAPTVPSFRNATLHNRTSFEATDRLRIDLAGRFYAEESEGADFTSGPGGAIIRLTSAQTQSDAMVQPGVSWRPMSGAQVDAVWTMSRYSSTIRMDEDASGAAFFRDDFVQRYAKPDLQAQVRITDRHEAIAGAGLVLERLDADRYPAGPAFTTRFGYVQHSWRPGDRFELHTGLRYDAHSEYDDQWSPKVAVRVAASDRTQVRASVGRGFKAPDFRQLFLDFTNSASGYSVFGAGTVAQGLDRLRNDGQIARILVPTDEWGGIRAESSWAWNVGADIDLTHGVRFRVNGFRNDVKDMIETAPIAQKTNGSLVFSYFNLDEVVTQGLETELRWMLTPTWSLSAGYQWLDARIRIERTRTVQDPQGEVVRRQEVLRKPMFNRSRHAGTARLNYDDPAGSWGGNLRLTARGAFALMDANANGWADTDEMGSAHLVAHAAVSRRFNEDVTLTTGIDNIGDYRNTFVPHLPGRLLYLQASFRF